MKEKISALMDGQLEDAECEAFLKTLKLDTELRESWDVYHLIGDAMRGHSSGALSRHFSALLEAEPVVLAPRRKTTTKQTTRWALSAAASLAAVGFVGWMSYPFFGTQNEHIATAQPLVPPVEIRAIATPNMDDYRLAHQGFSSGFGMPGVAPYVRTVSAEDGQR